MGFVLINNCLQYTFTPLVYVIPSVLYITLNPENIIDIFSATFVERHGI